MFSTIITQSGCLVLLWLLMMPALADDQPAAGGNLSQQANNPIANMISVPFQFDANFDMGPRDRNQQILSIQPVIPFELSDDWLLVSRWVLPVIDTPDFDGGTSHSKGIGDLNPALFFVPSANLTGLSDNLLFGFGPNLQLPTATDSELGGDKVGLGPTALMVYTSGKWLFDVLASNTWSLGDRGDETNELLFEPFFTYNFTEEIYWISDSTVTADWNAPSSERWVVPIRGGLGRTFNIGAQALNANFQAYWNTGS